MDPIRVGGGLVVSALLVGGLAALAGPDRLFGLLRAGDPVLLGAVAAGVFTATGRRPTP